jgi:hypothetical protein
VPDKSSVFNKLRLRRLEGTDPDILEFANDRRVNLVRVPIHSGIGPVRELKGMLRSAREVRAEKVDGMGPTN